MSDKLPDSGALSADDALGQEFAAIFPDAPRGGDDANWTQLTTTSRTALCLSGGGIRSATFSLGAMQGLARAGLFGDFDYLSTVSGGGYIGSWLSRHMAGELANGAPIPGTTGDPLAALRETPDSVRPPEHPLRRLRSFSNYLSPSLGLSLDSLTVVTIFVRNLLLNLLFWVPLLLLLALLPWCASAAARWLGGGAYSYFDGKLGSIDVAALGVPAVAAAIWLALAAVVLLGGWRFSEVSRERLSRIAAAPLLIGIPWLLVFVAFVYVPQLVIGNIGRLLSPSQASAAGGMIAILTSIVGYWSRYGPDLRKKAYGVANALNVRILDLLAIVALLALAFGATLATHACMQWWSGESTKITVDTLRQQDGRVASWPFALLVGGLALLATAASFLVGVNRFSLHALYGNRLVRAYLGSARRWRHPLPLTDFDPADNFAMAGLAGGPSHPGPTARPFHVVNMTLNITRSTRGELDWQERKGASFVATPLHSGSSVTGYVASRDFAGDWGMTLGRAMTISGAAASPNMGYHSSRPMALLMTMFNVRLGWWVPNPAWVAREGPVRRSEPRFGLRYVLREALSGTSFHSNWLYLSDGGHFDNLGLYEMVRRRCTRIVVVDAGCDGEFKHGDLHNAIRKIAVDLAVPIDLPPHLPGQTGPAERERVAIGTIRYSSLGDGYPDGELFVLKPVLTGDEPPALRAYAEVSRRGGKTFPHHSTSDQFFNETQFESYRRLGEWSVASLLKALSERTGAVAPAIAAAVADPPRPILTGLEGAAAAVRNLGPGQMLLGLVATAGAIGATATIADRAADGVIDATVAAMPAPARTPPQGPAPRPTELTPSITGSQPQAVDPSNPDTPRTPPASKPGDPPEGTGPPGLPADVAIGPAAVPPSLGDVVQRLDTVIGRLPADPAGRDRALRDEIIKLRLALERRQAGRPPAPVDLQPVLDALKAMQDRNSGTIDTNLSEVVKQLRIIAGRTSVRGQ